MKNLKLCEAVILETLRHHSPVAHVVRCAQADAELQLRGGKTLHIQQGDTILLSMFGLHHHPDLWPEPNKFMPERFLGRDAGGEGDASAQAGGRGGIANSFIPFVLGPRSCIGQVFARLEAKVILVRILQGYRLDLVPGQKILPQFRVTNRPRFGVKAVVAPL
jgi:cytochrome P450